MEGDKTVDAGFFLGIVQLFLFTEFDFYNTTFLLIN